MQNRLWELTVWEYTDAAVTCECVALSEGIEPRASHGVRAVQIRPTELTVWEYTDAAVEPHCTAILVSVLR